MTVHTKRLLSLFPFYLEVHDFHAKRLPPLSLLGAISMQTPILLPLLLLFSSSSRGRDEVRVAS